MKYPINGGGALAMHVDLFFESIGIDLLVGYGLTETSPVISCRSLSDNVRGSSGTPLAKTEVKIIDIETNKVVKFFEKGKILVRGPQVMKGYLNNPVATKKVLQDDGWFDTGDLGFLIPRGSLVITGREKDTIVLSNGENIEPVPLEDCIKSCDLISQAMILGQDEKNLSALIVIDKNFFDEWILKTFEGEIKKLENKKDLENIKKAIKNKLNMLLSQRPQSRSFERLKDIAIVEPFTIDNGMLTQTLKQKRDQIRIRDKKYIEEIYGKQIKT